MAPYSPTVRGGSGHTLVELLVVLGGTALVASFAAPTFRELGADVRRDALIEDLRATLLLARAEALARGTPVVVCASADGRTCGTSAEWSRGWLASTRPPGLPAGRIGAPLASVRPDARIGIEANRAHLEFQPTASAATTATFTICDPRGVGAARAIVVSRTGRVRTTRAGQLACA